jgi:adenylylsulfate kinase
MSRPASPVSKGDDTVGCAGTVWITGLSASGKSTLATALHSSLRRQHAVLIDGEHMRARLGDRYGHSIADRQAVLHHTVAAAQQYTALGRPVVVATISHTRAMRRFAREQLGPFLEVFLDCPAQVCAARDYKSHYARALRGEYDCFIGVTHPYERSEAPLPELTLDTDALGVSAASDLLHEAARTFFAALPQPADRSPRLCRTGFGAARE